MTDDKPSVVFDCVIYLQAIIGKPGNPAAECLNRAERGEIKLWASQAVLQEIALLPGRPRVAQHGVTNELINAFIRRLSDHCQMVWKPPSVFVHPIDPKDSRYIDLAVAADAKLIVSRDNHMLNLTNPAKPWSAEFRARFPNIEVLTPVELLTRLRTNEGRT